MLSEREKVEEERRGGDSAWRSGSGGDGDEWAEKE